MFVKTYIMKRYKLALTALLFSFVTISQAQNAALLSGIPETKEELIAIEDNVLATIKWLEETPIDQEEAKRKLQYSFLVAWITKAPNVSIELHSYSVDLAKKNSDMLIFFMAGWTKYSLENNYSNDAIKGNLAGVKLVLEMYQKDGFKKDKFLQKLQKLSDKGELEGWVKDQIKG